MEERAVTLEVVTLAIHEDVVHEDHTEHAGIDVEVTEDQYETSGLWEGREQLVSLAASNGVLSKD